MPRSSPQSPSPAAVEFALFGPLHLAILLGLIVSCIALPWLALELLSPGWRVWLGRGLALGLSATVSGWTVLQHRSGDWDPRNDLPLDLCNLLALIAPLYTWSPRLAVHEVVYYMVMAGTLQAVLTPHLTAGYGHRTFFKYWIVHAGLIVLVIYESVALSLYPTAIGILTAFAATLGYIAVAIPINRWLGANYGYVSAKPPTASLLDHLGPWPWYIFGALFIGVLLFGLFHLPFAFLSL